MKRNRKDNAKKERIIMLASSAFVLTALTMTGIYMQAGDEKAQDNGYTLDFTAIEDNVESKSKEIAQNTPAIEDSEKSFDKIADQGFSPEDDLDYMPLEAGSGNIEIPGVTTVLGEESAIQEKSVKDTGDSETEEPAEEPAAEKISEEQPGAEQANTAPVIPEQTNVEPAEISGPELHFAAGDGLLRPLEGEVLIPFNMSGSEYFSTLEAYKYNPALVIAAREGTSVTACAAGKVIDIFQDSEIGQAVTVDLGDGYRLTYGQLKGLNVALNSYIGAGDMIASVAAPTKYYCVEGANLYLKLTLNGEPVDPELLFR
ncbi:MAG: M23 family metallopeptidase [Butyrivibrio sp.]|nr:M23 family metallopeptidase [Acetatifactor muris]MCM1558184.1 M23 family metallopeptidase [Butyrivibrio sp.]